MKNFIILGVMLITFGQAKAYDIKKLAERLAIANFEVKVDSAANSETIYQLRAENALGETEFEIGNMWGNPTDAGNKFHVSVAQGFDWPGLYAVRNKAIRQTELLSSFSQTEKLQQKLVEARTMLSAYYYSKCKEQAIYEAWAKTDTLCETAKEANRRGDMTLLDLNTLLLNKIKIRNLLNECKRESRELELALVEFNGGKEIPELKSLRKTESIDLRPLSYYEERFLEVSPSLNKLKTQSALASTYVKMAKRDWLPGLTIGYAYEHEGADRFNGFTVGLNFALFGNKARRKAAYSRQFISETEADVAKMVGLATLRANYTLAIELSGELKLYQDIYKGVDNIRLLDIALKEGVMTLHEYLGYRQDFLEAQIDYYNLCLRYESVIEPLIILED